MSTWCGIVVPNTDVVRAALARRKVELAPGEGDAVIAIRGGLRLHEEAERLAADVARESGSEVLALFCVTSVDAYSIVELGPRGVLRRLTYSGEGEGWEVEGDPRPWETELHLHGTREEFLENLEEEEWTQEELAAAAAAYDARSVRDLPRLPRLEQPAFTSFVARYGETAAVADRRGVIARMLGFG